MNQPKIRPDEALAKCGALRDKLLKREADKLSEALKRIELNGTGIVAAAQDDDPSRIRPKLDAMRSALAEAQEATDRLNIFSLKDKYIYPNATDDQMLKEYQDLHKRWSK